MILFKDLITKMYIKNMENIINNNYF